ncbi:MAG: hypothetical protein ACTSYZ_15110 [Candidatus Helarchaeota archaeon]
MQNRVLYSILIIAFILPIFLVPNAEAMPIVEESFNLNGLKGYTVHGISSALVQHKITIKCNDSVSVYILNRALNMSEVNTQPTDYVYLFTGSNIVETFVLAGPVVSIIIYSSNNVSGSISWDYGLGIPDEGIMVIGGIIGMISLGVGLFVIYRIYRWRKLKE